MLSTIVFGYFHSGYTRPDIIQAHYYKLIFVMNTQHLDMIEIHEYRKIMIEVNFVTTTCLLPHYFWRMEI